MISPAHQAENATAPASASDITGPDPLDCAMVLLTRRPTAPHTVTMPLLKIAWTNSAGPKANRRAMSQIATMASQVDVVSGDTDRCPYSVGESGSRTTIMTGMAVVEAVKDLQQQIAARGMPTGNDVLVASATPSPTTDGKMRQCFGAHFVEVEVDTRLGTTRLTKYVAVHESGRIINPQTARDQIRGAVLQGIGQALHEDLLYDPASGQPLTIGYYRARHLTHLDVPTIEVHFLEVDDGYGPFGAKTVGESGIILAPAAVANAIFNATGTRMTSLPITRDKILGAMG